MPILNIKLLICEQDSCAHLIAVLSWRKQLFDLTLPHFDIKLPRRRPFFEASIFTIKGFERSAKAKIEGDVNLRIRESNACFSVLPHTH